MQLNDDSTCSTDPRLTVNSGGVVVRACVYAQCNSGSSTNDLIVCNDGSNEVTDLAGSKGCCESGLNPTFDFEHDCSCPGFLCDDDTALIRVKIDSLGAPAACTSFSFTVSF